MVQSFRLAKEDWRDRYKTIVRNIGRDLLNKDDITYLADYMIYCLGREMASMAKEFQELWSGEGQPALHEALRQSDTLERMELRFEDALGLLFERMKAIREKRNYAGIIRDIRVYMEQSFANPNLSLDYLSEKFGINGKYLSKLFKEETGEKFVDYLIELRIRHARKLLAESGRSVQEVAEEVGYASAISFSRVFKKVTGVSPGDYREQQAGEAG
ncbi:helix-turn-helix domain-containing protein [Gordoniibacillus kamchatkensis]|uniref:helix-turn-helix domain-containing protein n=1 Tax=Gordoniibacillus kamchatkensis TaxID=1590651 RepID=UPI001E339C86|nr:helix-turn-helix domain-containing protein [Paenibacillus sp. VKM B-2647]